MYHTNYNRQSIFRNAFLFVTMMFSTMLSVNADVIASEGFESLALGALNTDTHPQWQGMLEGNLNGQPLEDWSVVDGGGHDWLAPDGGTIDGGNNYFSMLSRSNQTGRAFWSFLDGGALQTDTGAANSIYLRYTIVIEDLANPWADNPEEAGGPFVITRLNSSWSFKTVFKPKDQSYSNSSNENRFFYELEKDVNTPEGTLHHIMLEEKLGEPQTDTVYLVVTRYDFDDLGVLVGVNAWVNPVYADKENPDLASILPATNQYDTFVNPIVSMDMTTYFGHLSFDNIVIGNSWDSVVPMASNTDAFWGPYPIINNSANTDMWMGWLDVTFFESTGWVYSYMLDQWMYTPAEPVDQRSGEWFYILK